MSGTITKYFRVITFEFESKSTYGAKIELEVEETGVPVSPINYKHITGDTVDIVEYDDKNDILVVGASGVADGVLSDFSKATEKTTYTEKNPEGTWSYTLEVVPPEPVFGFNLDGMVDKDYIKQY